MGINIAQKRGRKAQRRKQMVAQKRRAEELEASLPARVQRAAQLPVQACFLTEDLLDGGMGTLVLARGNTPDRVTLSAYLLDTFCLGIKNVTFDVVDGEYLQFYMDTMDRASPMVAVDPSYARKLLRDLAAWSRSLGFAPHRDFATVERLFGDVNAEASDAVFRFGRDGKPFYVPGPNDTAPLIRRRMEQLRQRLGDGGFDWDSAA